MNYILKFPKSQCRFVTEQSTLVLSAPSHNALWRNDNACALECIDLSFIDAAFRQYLARVLANFGRLQPDAQSAPA